MPVLSKCNQCRLQNFYRSFKMKKLYQRKTISDLQCLSITHGEHELIFYQEKGEEITVVWEIVTVGQSSLAKPGTLPTKFLVRHFLNCSKRMADDELEAINTPFNGNFYLSKEECKEIYKYLKEFK